MDNIKVAVAMSGGVDSSVTAALLVEQGYSVIGLTLRLWNGEPDLETSKKKIQDTIDQAKSVAQILEIPHEVINCSEEFQKRIVGYFIQSHRLGKTPNPCFICNKQIKWGLLMDQAVKMGAEFLASGHYARLVKKDTGKIELHKGLDPKKDQSYILAGLRQDQLSKAMLPLGDMTKIETRQIARRYNFKNSDFEESQDLCFLGDLDQPNFLSIYAPDTLHAGMILNSSGEFLGTHQGLANYTIGQRKGLGSGFHDPIFVLKKDIKKNTIIAGTAKELGVKRVLLDDVNWISGEAPELPLKCGVKIRYKANPVSSTIIQNANFEYFVIFDAKVRDATPGQFAVFYNEDMVIGSGVITEIYGEES